MIGSAFSTYRRPVADGQSIGEEEPGNRWFMHSTSPSRFQVSAMPPSLEELARDLDALGVSAFLAAFPDDRPRLADWAGPIAALPDDVRPIYEFLLLGRPTDRALLPPSIHTCFPALEEAAILNSRGETAQLAEAVLMRPTGLWLFAAPPSPFETDLYFGADSIQLARHLDIRPGSAVLDLCSGTGLQALLAAERGATAHAVEINPVATAVARVNAALNGIADRVSLWSGNLFDPLPTGKVYDQVIANIPFLPGAANGSDGFDVGREILRELPSWLAPDGTACLTALALTTATGIVLPEGLREFADHTGRGMVVALGERWPVDAESSLVQALADEAADDGGDFSECVEEAVQAFRRRDVIEARTAFVHIGAVEDASPITILEEAVGDRS
ncbi:methyltransferase [Streptomyces sp. NPDC059340]|uniref:methyltransferase n=1 Tax=Streptomyces sp. NPDC059340 TaxID=3346806 RepID=UPI0036C3E7F3